MFEYETRNTLKPSNSNISVCWFSLGPMCLVGNSSFLPKKHCAEEKYLKRGSRPWAHKRSMVWSGLVWSFWTTDGTNTKSYHLPPPCFQPHKHGRRFVQSGSHEQNKELPKKNLLTEIGTQNIWVVSN